jgi:type IV pilus assembly protein PilA
VKEKKITFANSKNRGGLKTKKGKKAFTLIELLAIIVILAIIAVITVPIILNIIENSKKGAATDSAYGYKDAVNKWYVSKLSEDHDFKISGEYTVTNGVLNGLGVNNVEIPVSGNKPTSGKLHYTNNVLDDGCLVIGDYKITFKSDGSINETVKGDCSDYEFSQGNSGNQTATPLEIGTTVNYVTSLNNVELSDWKVFYSDSDYTYLILSDYLPNAAVSITNIETYGTYGVYTSVDRATLINAMTTPSNWSALINNGTINETPLSSEVKSNVNVTAMGSPTIELWVNSWNETYSNDTLYIRYVGTNDIDNNNFYATGYAIGDSANPTTLGIYLSSKTGYDNILYFPHHETSLDDSSCYGYWLASPHAGSDEAFSVMTINYDGASGHYQYDGDYAFRPVIKLPTSVLNQ